MIRFVGMRDKEKTARIGDANRGQSIRIFTAEAQRSIPAGFLCASASLRFNLGRIQFRREIVT